jgi:hypothetical protein
MGSQVEQTFFEFLFYLKNSPMQIVVSLGLDVELEDDEVGVRLDVIVVQPVVFRMIADLIQFRPRTESIG